MKLRQPLLVMLVLVTAFVAPIHIKATKAASNATSTWPYAQLQSELDGLYATIESSLPSTNQPDRSHYLMTMDFCDGNIGAALVSDVNYTINKNKAYIDTLQRNGFNSILITAAWPLLDPNSTDPNLSRYQTVYSSIVSYAQSKGFYVVFASGIAASGAVDYTRYSSIDQIFQGRRRQAWWVASHLQPNVVVAGAEPGSDKMLLGQYPNITDISNLTPQYWGNHFTQLLAGAPQGTRSLYAGGASPQDSDDFATAAIQSGLTRFDFHPFPLANAGIIPPAPQYWQRMLARIDQAQAAGMIAISTQTSPYKESAQEVAAHQLSYEQVYNRDAWAEWGETDLRYEELWHQITLKKGLQATSYFFGLDAFFGGYVPYQSGLSEAAAEDQVDHQANVNAFDPNYVMDPQGQLWRSFVPRIPDGTPTPPQFRSDTIDFINAYRTSNGLRPVTSYPSLNTAAQNYSATEAQAGTLSHTGPNGSTTASRLTAVGYPWVAYGELLDGQYTTADDVVTDWMNHPNSLGNILDPQFTDIGVGMTYLQNDPAGYNYYWVGELGKR
ncbi:MAG: hypothetical protein H0X37_12455 [Herpetosiphonaceae bacterium]|nr:hypothetical protein [Herpetosiphonaceae bacterium]